MTLHARQFEKIECLVGGIGHLAPADDELIRSHHTTVKPVNDAAASNAANHADIGAIDLRNNVADEKFRETACVWERQCFQTFLNAHSNVLPALGAKAARGKLCNGLTHVSSELSPHPTLYGGLCAQVDSTFQVPFGGTRA